MSGASSGTYLPRSVLTVFPTISAKSAVGLAEAEALTTFCVEIPFLDVSRIRMSLVAFIRLTGIRGRLRSLLLENRALTSSVLRSCWPWGHQAPWHAVCRRLRL